MELAKLTIRQCDRIRQSVMQPNFSIATQQGVPLQDPCVTPRGRSSLTDSHESTPENGGRSSTPCGQRAFLEGEEDPETLTYSPGEISRLQQRIVQDPYILALLSQLTLGSGDEKQSVGCEEESGDDLGGDAQDTSDEGEADSQEKSERVLSKRKFYTDSDESEESDDDDRGDDFEAAGAAEEPLQDNEEHLGVENGVVPEENHNGLVLPKRQRMPGEVIGDVNWAGIPEEVERNFSHASRRVSILADCQRSGIIRRLFADSGEDEDDVENRVGPSGNVDN